MVLRLAAAQASLEVRHELRNVGELPLQLAPWSITQLPLHGTVLLPQPRAVPGHHVHPNRTLVFWPYTSWEDPRFRPLDGLLTIEAQTGPNLKPGTFNEAGWIGYLRNGVGLVRRFEPAAGRPHPDLGCNVEVYVGSEFLELELLGPTTDLDPGATVVLVEHWEIRAVEVDDTADLRSLAERIGQREPAAGIAASWLAG
jgi:hypothetical protein